jgi:uncharacterized protein YndB with AHSA1/START domain
VAGIRVQARAEAPVQTVWAVLSAQKGMAAWAPIRAVALEREGDPPPDGIGAIRVLSRPPFEIREEITGADVPVRLAYRMLSGLPVRDYSGETTLTPRDGATDILWTVSMTARLPGLTFIVRRVIRDLAHGLVAESERIAGQERRS